MIIFLTTQDSVEFHYNIFDKTINVDDDDEEDDRVIDFFRLHGHMAQKVLSCKSNPIRIVLLLYAKQIPVYDISLIL